MRVYKILDLFCCQGGGGMGYHKAGFDVVGVDIKPQPRYPFSLLIGDALQIVKERRDEFDAFHASPPCQAFTRARKLQGNTHIDLIGVTREALKATGKPYVIENVPGAPLHNPVVLCGLMFELNFYRHRLFETNIELSAVQHPPHTAPLAKMGRPPKEHEVLQFVGQVEIDKKCQAVLAKHWPTITRMGDIRDVKGNEFGAVDLVCGGFPCQPFSTAGKRKGEADNRFLWPEMVRVITAIRPTWVLGENVAGIVSMALDKVHSDLESIGYTVQSFIIPACAVGAIHRRDRVWIIGNTKSSAIEPECEICGRQNPDRAGSVDNVTDTKSQQAQSAEPG